MKKFRTVTVTALITALVLASCGTAENGPAGGFDEADVAVMFSEVTEETSASEETPADTTEETVVLGGVVETEASQGSEEAVSETESTIGQTVEVTPLPTQKSEAAAAATVTATHKPAVSTEAPTKPVAILNPTATPEPAAASRTTATPTPASKYAKYLSCSDCGQKTMVDHPHYTYTVPARTHTESNPTWDYGIQHCHVKINWALNCDYNGHEDEKPSISVDFEYKVDKDGNPLDQDEMQALRSAAVDLAFKKALDWMKSVGAEETGYFSYSTIRDSLDKINYQENPYTVVDEPEHEHERAAYVCENCGSVCFYGEDKLIR